MRQFKLSQQIAAAMGTGRSGAAALEDMRRGRAGRAGQAVFGAGGAGVGNVPGVPRRVLARVQRGAAAAAGLGAAQSRQSFALEQRRGGVRLRVRLRPFASVCFRLLPFACSFARVYFCSPDVRLTRGCTCVVYGTARIT